MYCCCNTKMCDTQILKTVINSLFIYVLHVKKFGQPADSLESHKLDGDIIWRLLMTFRAANSGFPSKIVCNTGGQTVRGCSHGRSDRHTREMWMKSNEHDTTPVQCP